MSAFDALEKRALDLSSGAGSDRGEAVVVIGLHTSAPPESHDGSYGIAGEPVQSVAYRRARVAFGQAVEVDGVMQASNTEPVTITGLTPGTYTHFALHGSTSAGVA